MLTLTERAAQKALKAASIEKKPPVLRVGVRGGGCSGFNYFYEFSETRDGDYVLEAHGLTVVCDPKSLALMQGTEIDYDTSLLNGGWRFHNPRAKKSCGCGESFTVA
jgi:iron-sulfur cluster assembly protein